MTSAAGSAQRARAEVLWAALVEARVSMVRAGHYGPLDTGDERLVDWLAGWEPHVVERIAGWVASASEEGAEEGSAGR